MKLWAWNDAWILTATCLARKRGGATLAEVIAAADVINHAIPTAGQLSRAFSRLVDCGIVQVKNDRYLLPPNWQRAVRKALQGKGGLFSNVDKCLKWLKKTGLEPGQSSTVTVSDSDVRTAYDRYCVLLKKSS
jgi:hypothetical protein